MTELVDHTPQEWHDYLVWAMHWANEKPEDIVAAAPTDWNAEHTDIAYLSIHDDYWEIPECYRYLWTEKNVYFLVNEWVYDSEKEEEFENWRMWWVPRNPSEQVD